MMSLSPYVSSSAGNEQFSLLAQVYWLAIVFSAWIASIFLASLWRNLFFRLRQYFLFHMYGLRELISEELFSAPNLLLLCLLLFWCLSYIAKTVIWLSPG